MHWASLLFVVFQPHSISHFFLLDALHGAELVVSLLDEVCEKHDVVLNITGDGDEVHVTATNGANTRDVDAMSTVNIATEWVNALALHHCH